MCCLVCGPKAPLRGGRRCRCVGAATLKGGHGARLLFHHCRLCGAQSPAGVAAAPRKSRGGAVGSCIIVIVFCWRQPISCRSSLHQTAPLLVNIEDDWARCNGRERIRRGASPSTPTAKVVGIGHEATPRGRPIAANEPQQILVVPPGASVLRHRRQPLSDALLGEPQRLHRRHVAGPLLRLGKHLLGGLLVRVVARHNGLHLTDSEG